MIKLTTVIIFSKLVFPILLMSMIYSYQQNHFIVTIFEKQNHKLLHLLRSKSHINSLI